MRPELSRSGWRTTLPAAWRQPLAVLAVSEALALLAFARDWAAMVDQWWNSSTYTHILLIPAILIWLVAQRWPGLRALQPSGWWPGLWLVAAGMLLWVLGAFAALSLLRQLGTVAVAVAIVPAVLGPTVAAGLAFPLAYAVFLVPFGDELVPILQEITARLTVALVHLSGVAARIDGVFIDTPAGLFEVAEACSGIKFLVAMIALGVLVGNLCFRRWGRRAAFLALCIVVPVLANGVRAWGTIFAAQWIGAARAGGMDHIVYGWVFFALVIAAVLALGWRFFDRAPGDPLVDPAALRQSPLLRRLGRSAGPPARLAPAILAIILAGQGWAAAAERLQAPLPPQIHLPEVAGWHRVDYRPALWWEPRARGADHRLLGRYADAAGETVDVFVALYASQADGREAGAFGEGALVPDSGWAWRADAPSLGPGQAEWLAGPGPVQRLAVTYYRTGTLLTGRNLDLKLATMADRLLLRPRPTMVLILSAEQGGGQKPAARLARFAAAAGPLGPWMDRIGSGR